jgi:phosphate transport system protein
MNRTEKSSPEHIVQSYDEELKRLSSTILRMGGIAESQLASAIQAVARRDGELAERVVQMDVQIDQLADEVDALCTKLLALRQPMAVDLRGIVAGIKLAAEIERIGDYAKNVAKRALTLNLAPAVPAAQSVPRVGALVQRMIKDVLDAYAQRDVARAIDVWNRDEEVDQLYNSLFRELLTYMMEDPRTITPSAHLLFIAKAIERIGDHATNMAEEIYFLIEGRRLQEERPKRDETASYVGPGQPGGQG